MYMHETIHLPYKFQERIIVDSLISFKVKLPKARRKNLTSLYGDHYQFVKNVIQ